ncbi:retrovirus-related pol polyprotein from transposon TNT 1-94 [Tanacetum coccineum]
MLIFSRAPLFLWAEAIATACYTQNRSIIHRRFDKIPYELINGRKPDISFLHVFGALCYPKNDREDIGKLGVKGDISFSLVILPIPVLIDQNQRDLLRNTPLDRVEVLGMIEKRSKVRIGIMLTEAELALEQSQQGVSYEVSVSIKGVKE